MRLLSRPLLGIAAIASLAAIFAGTPGPAAAGLFDFLGGGGHATRTSGRQLVAFPGNAAPGTIIVKFSHRRLYYVLSAQRAIAYPIGAPIGKARWTGVNHVSSKRINPMWTPTAEMRRENPTLPAYVPGGHPRNPLGVRAMYLGSSTYRIHGTDAPWTIGHEVSQGCVRMYNDDVIDLYNRTPIGTKVVVIW
jgi:lipoprotein-anchoring transpeptidase ErfK/SrfK